MRTWDGLGTDLVYLSKFVVCGRARYRVQGFGVWCFLWSISPEAHTESTQPASGENFRGAPGLCVDSLGNQGQEHLANFRARLLLCYINSKEAQKCRLQSGLSREQKAVTVITS